MNKEICNHEDDMNRTYKLYFEPDGFCSYYPSDDDTGWELDEILEMVKEYNKEKD